MVEKLKRPRIEVTEDGTELRLLRGGRGELWWIAKLDDIVLLAEYTTPDGPLAEDYFFVFVELIDGTFHFAQMPLGCDGRDETLKKLREHWRADFVPKALRSTGWDSNVMWPPDFAGQPFYEFTEAKPETFMDKVRRRLRGPTIEYKLTAAVIDFLDAVRSKRTR